MKKIILLFVFFMTVQGFAQTNGISYQAIIMNPKGEQLPGVNNANSPVVNKNICLVFKFVDEFSNIEYQETVQTKTDGFGMVNLVIGKGTQTAGYAASFQAIVWNSSKKSLIVGINTNGNCASYTEISNQEFSYAPLAFSAINAENVTGVVAIENGGTNAVTVLGAKTNLQLENVDNTTDLNKPVSTATQTALNLKENTANKSIDILIDGNSDIKYPSVKSVKMYVDGKLLTSSNALTDEIARATTAENTIAANLVTETNNRTVANTTLTTNLATEVTNRTAADVLKEDVANKSTNVTTDGTSDTKYPSVKSVKTYVDASAASSSTALANEVSRATTAENAITANLTAETSARTSADATLTTNLAAEVSNRTAADLLKEDLANKSTNVTTDGTSDTKYPSVKSVKTYVDVSIASSSTALANEVTRATAAENTIAANLTTETSTRTSADATLTANLATEISNRAAADLLKEDLANKSTNVTTDGTSDTKYPSVKSVKTYVDTNAASASTALANEVSRATTAENTIAANLTTETSARTSADATLQTNIDAVQADVDANEAAANTALNLKAPLASPTFTGTVSGITKTMVGLANVDNTTDLLKPVSIATQTALDLKVDKVSGERLINATEITKLSNQSGINTGDQDISGIAANATKIGDLTSLTTTAKSNLVAAVNEIDAGKAPLASPTFTGTVSGITKTMVGLGNVDNTTDLLKPVSIATQTALDLKVDKVSGKGLSTEDYTTVEKTKLAAITGTNTGDQDITGIAANTTKIGDLTNLTTTAKSSLVAAVNEIDAGKAPLASPTFTGTVSGITKTMVGLGNVDNTTDLNKPVSTATQTALDLKVDKVSGKGLSTEDYSTVEKTKLAAITGTNTGDQDISGIAANTTKIGDLTNLTTTAKSSLVAAVNENGAGIATNTTKIGDLTSLTTTANSSLVAAVNEIQAGKAPLASPTFTGTVSGIDKTMVGLANVDNTSDANKPVSTATQTALDLKAPLASPTFTGTVTASGTLTANTIVKSGGTSSQFLKADGSVDSSTYLTTAVTTLDGLTDSKSGGANFSNSLLIGHQTTGVLSSADRNIGIGIGALSSITQGDDNIAVGYQALTSNSTGYQNIAIGRQSMLGNVTGSSNTAVGLEALESNSTGHHNAAFGHLTMINNTTGYQNAAYGQEALAENTIGYYNTAMGAESLYNNSQGNLNVAVGFGAMGSNLTGSNNTAVGSNTNVSSSALTNATAIGYGAIVNASNKIQLGNTSVTLVNTSGAITATGAITSSAAVTGTSIVSSGAITGTTIVKSGGTSSQFLKADGSVDSNTYVSSASAASTYLPLTGGTLTGGLTGTTLTTSGNVTSLGTVSGTNGSFGRLILNSATESSPTVNNYDVSGIGILFIVPNSNWENIAGLSGGVTGQVLQIINANNDAISCCTGIVFQNDNVGGTQKIKCSSDLPLGSNQGVSLVFDGTYWRVMRPPN